MIKGNQTEVCNCVRAPCDCSSATHLPPMPSGQPPTGFEYYYDANGQRWLMRRIQFSGISDLHQGSTPTPWPITSTNVGGIFTKITQWAQDNPVPAIGLAITAYVAFFKKK